MFTAFVRAWMAVVWVKPSQLAV